MSNRYSLMHAKKGVDTKSIYRENCILSFQTHIVLLLLIPFWPMYWRTYSLYNYHFIDSLENNYSVLLTVLTGFGHFPKNLLFRSIHQFKLNFLWFRMSLTTNYIASTLHNLPASVLSLIAFPLRTFSGEGWSHKAWNWTLSYLPSNSEGKSFFRGQ